MKKLAVFSFISLIITLVNSSYALDYLPLESDVFLVTENMNAHDLVTEGDVLKMTITPVNINASYYLV